MKNKKGYCSACGRERSGEGVGASCSNCGFSMPPIRLSPRQVQTIQRAYASNKARQKAVLKRPWTAEEAEIINCRFSGSG